MKLLSSFLCFLVLSGALAGQETPHDNGVSKPLPPVSELLKAVEAHEDHDDALLQQYTYHSHWVMEEFDGDENVKKTTVVDSESIPINGVRVRRIVARNGKPLSPDEAKKENERFDKEVEKAKKNKAKYDAKVAEAKREGKSNDSFLTTSRILQLGTFSNERRVDLTGRPTIVLDYAGNRDVKAKNAFERVVTDLVGTVWIDEEDKVLARVEAHFLNDFKVAGGLLMDIHKGLVFTMEQQKINGEVWLPKEYGGQGKASLGLVVARVHGRSRAYMSDYRKYHTDVKIQPASHVLDENGNPLPEQPAPTQGAEPEKAPSPLPQP